MGHSNPEDEWYFPGSFAR